MYKTPETQDESIQGVAAVFFYHLFPSKTRLFAALCTVSLDLNPELQYIHVVESEVKK